MATQLFFVDDAVSYPNIHRGTNSANLRTTATGWTVRALSSSRGTGVDFQTSTTVAGPTLGIEIGGTEFISLPLAADTTISGTITCNIWGYETDMAANAAINVLIERLDSTGAIVSTIAQSVRTVELAVSASAGSVNNFTVTPTSTNMLKGDRLRVCVFADDSTTNMGAGFSVAHRFNASSASVDGDSYISFNETFSFQTTEPSGSTLYLTSTAGPAVGANDEREMWTTRGGSATTAVRDTATGWTTPLQWTATAGGTAIEWYSKPLQAFTLDGLVRVNLRAHESNALANAGIRAELAVTAGDGSGAVVWGAATFIDQASIGATFSNTGTAATGELSLGELPVRGWLAGDSVAVTDGQRLRLRVYVDDLTSLAMVTGHTATLTYNGPTLAASGDSWIQLPQTVTELAGDATASPGVIARSFTVPAATPMVGSTITAPLIARSLSLPAATITGSPVTTITGLLAWFDARTGPNTTTDGATVIAWTARAGTWEGASPQFQQFTATNRPIYKTSIINGNPVLRFDGVDNYMADNNSYPSDATYTIFVVAKRGAGGSTTRTVFAIDGGGIDNTNAALYNTSGSTSWFYDTPTTAVPGASPDVFSTVMLRYNSTSSLDLASNGFTVTNIDPNDAYQSGGVTLRVGSGTTTGNFFSGDVAEIIVYDSALSSGDRTLIEDYLTAKYFEPGTANPAVIARTFTVDAPTVPVSSSVTAPLIDRPILIPAATASASSSATASPSITVLATVQPVATPAASSTVAPAVIARTVDVPVSTPQTGSSTTPAVIARSITIDQATPGTGSTVTPAVTARTISLPSPTPATGSTVAPAVLAWAVVIPAPTPTAGSSPSPATIAQTLGLPLPTVGAGAGVSPTTVARALTLPAPIPTAGSTLTPSAVTLALMVPAVAATGGGAATATPATVALALLEPVPTVTLGGSTTPAVTALNALLGAPTTFAGISGTATPAAIVRALLTPAPTPTAGSQTAPPAIALAALLPAPSVISAAAGTATPGVIPLNLLEPAATPSASSKASPAAMAFAIIEPAPTVSGVVASTPAAIARAFALPTPTPKASSTTTAATIALALQLGQPLPTVSDEATPGTIVRAFTLPAPSITGAGTSSPATITLVLLLPDAGAVGSIFPDLTPYIRAYVLDGTRVYRLNGIRAYVLEGNRTYNVKGGRTYEIDGRRIYRP